VPIEHLITGPKPIIGGGTGPRPNVPLAPSLRPLHPVHRKRRPPVFRSNEAKAEVYLLSLITQLDPGICIKTRGQKNKVRLWNSSKYIAWVFEKFGSNHEPCKL